MRGTPVAGLALITAIQALSGCSSGPGRPAMTEAMVDEWIAEMDARPAEEQLPSWDVVRSRMVRPAPRVGDPAPDFELRSIDGGEMVRLSAFQGSLPVVLIFGSWT